MRQVKEIRCEISPVNEIPVTETEFTEWLNRQAAQRNFSTALAFADDGVIWGRFDGAWKWSSDLHWTNGNQELKISPPFRLNTLQQIRLFGVDAELFLWRVDGRWQGRVIVDGTGEPRDYFDEEQLLWGDEKADEKEGFALMREGKQGLHHTPPAQIARVGKLMTRSYLEYDADGCAKIFATRLVDAHEEAAK